jgi:predicted amidohydrolase
MLKITIAQLNYTVGDIEGNAAKMTTAAAQAAENGSELVVFSELSLTGYYPGDLLEEPTFMPRIAQALIQLQNASAQWPQLHWVVGTPAACTGPGKQLQNALTHWGQVLTHWGQVLSFAKTAEIE